MLVVILFFLSHRLLGTLNLLLSRFQVCVILKTVIHLGMDAYFVSATAWLLLIVVLSFFVLVLDNVIDTVYVCYAIDRDRGEVSKQKVHDVYVHLPISRSIRSPFAARDPPLSV